MTVNPQPSTIDRGTGARGSAAWPAAAFLTLTATAGAGEWSGYIGSELRFFPNAATHPGQGGKAGASTSFEAEFYHAWEDGGPEFVFTPFGRWDPEDEERSHFDLRELSLAWNRPDWGIKAGVSKVFWGVAESRHLVDVINQTDLVENIDGEEKLGQPMVNLTLVRDWGNLDLFLLPGFRERTFPGGRGRLRSGLRVDTDHPLFESGAGRRRVDTALRLSRVIGEFDLGFSYFWGTGRDPLFSPAQTADGETVLRPRYTLIQQAGLDLQWTHEAWLWKLEAISRSGRDQDYSAFVGGFEYTFYGVGGTAADLGALSELHFDTRRDRATDPFNDDLFLGARLSLNDERDSSLLAGLTTDLGDNASSFRVEFERRVGESTKLVIEAQSFARAPPENPLHALRDDDFLQVELRWYF